LTDVSFSRLRDQVYVVSVAIRLDIKIPLTDAELRQFFGQSGSWAQGMISRHLQYLGFEKLIARGCPIAAESD
jgi:hypothetical protein